MVKGDGRDTRGSTPTGVIAATSEIERTLVGSTALHLMGPCVSSEALPDRDALKRDLCHCHDCLLFSGIARAHVWGGLEM